MTVTTDGARYAVSLFETMINTDVMNGLLHYQMIRDTVYAS